MAALLAAAIVLACSPGPSLPPAATPSASPSAPPGAATPNSPGSSAATASPAAGPTLETAIVPGSVDASSLQVSATYDVDLGIDVGAGAIDVEVVIEARNDSGIPIDRLELNTVAARLGGLEVTGASVDDQAVEVAIDDQTLVVPFGGVLPAGASASVRLGYTATLRPGLDGSDWLFSRAGGSLTLYRWIPWVSRTVPFDRPNFGDPFVTPSSPLVRVTVATDAPMVLASAGATSETRARTWSFELRDVRDVALVLAPDFEVTIGNADGIQVRAFTRPGGQDGDRLVAQAGNALTKMADRLAVAYPLPTYTVAETTGGFGMESPGLIWIPSDTGVANVPYLVHHETAHQWFYGLVGSDQQSEPFADEAPSDLVARSVLGQLRASRCDNAPLDEPITRYGMECYYEIVYIQGANFLDDLRESMGANRFWDAMGDYLEANRLGRAGTLQLLEGIREASPVNLVPGLRERFPSLY